MGILNRKSGLTRRKFLRAGIPVTGLFVAACGSDRSFDAGDRPKLTEVHQRILEESIVVESAKSQPTQAALPHLPLKVHPLWSLFGATRSQYSGLIDRAASFDEVAPRLEMANFRQASESMTLGETVALMADTEPLDILIFPAETLEDLDDNDLLLPLDKVADIGEAIKPENYWPGMLEAGQIRGRQLAIPLHLGLWLLMYKKERLAEHGIRDPKDWPWNATQFSENTSRLTQVGARNDQADRYGFLQIVSENGASIPIPPSWVWMISAGSKLPNREGNEEALQEPAALAGLKVMDELINRHRSVYKVSNPASSRQLRGLIRDDRVSMISLPVNSGWFLSSWRDALSGGFELAALPGGEDRRTPTEVHMMVGASSWTKHPDFAMAGLANLYKSVGQQLFPSAVRTDVDMITTVEPVLRDSDSTAIQSALEKSHPIKLSKVEKELLTTKLDKAISVDKTLPEEAAKSAAEALREFRITKNNRRNQPPPPPPADPV